MELEEAVEQWRKKARDSIKSLGLGSPDDEAYWFARNMRMGYADFDKMNIHQCRRVILLVDMQKPPEAA